MSKSSQKVKRPKGFYYSATKWLQSSGLKLEEHYREFESDLTPLQSLPKQFEGDTHRKFLNEKHRLRAPMYVGKIPRGRVYGETPAIITPDNHLIWDVSLEYDRTPDTHRVFDVKKLPPPVYVPETLAVITFQLYDNYYHWMFDILPRMLLIKNSAFKFDRYLFNPIRTPYQKTTLQLLNIPNEKILTTQNSKHLKAKYLLVTPWIAYDGYVPKWAIDFLRFELLRRVLLTKEQSFDRIYISREKATKRKIINEEELMHTLNKYGFRKVFLEDHLVEEQIQIFATAKVIVAPHGAGLTNLAFSRPGTKVLEIFSPSYVNVCFWTLSTHVGLDYYYLIGEKKNSKGNAAPFLITNNILVNIEQLNHVLAHMLRK